MVYHIGIDSIGHSSNEQAEDSISTSTYINVSIYIKEGLL